MSARKAGDEFLVERCLLVKPEVFVYNIPPRYIITTITKIEHQVATKLLLVFRNTARGYRAADWNLSTPNWTGRLRCVAKGKVLEIRLEDKTSGELFAACPVEQYPGRRTFFKTSSLFF